MSHPAIALLLAITALAMLVLIFWPKNGVVSLLRRALRSGERESIEDALKHLYDCEYVGTPASLQSLAGALEIGTSRVARLIQRLETLGLVCSEDAVLRLTREGRSYALRIIRIHRMWEAYLAERTGFEEGEWHFEADRREHNTSTAQLQQMVRATGNPRFDPHGDPIPTEDGEVLARRGRPLSDCSPGSVVNIVHVEDEPEAIYAQLRAQSIRVNQRLTILDRTPERVLVEVDGGEHAMAPIVAGNVWVVVLPSDTSAESVDRLSSLAVGESRTVVGISPACVGLQRSRLLDLGLVPGTEVVNVMKSPAGDPTAYRVRGAVIALRHEQAELIQVQRKNNGEVVS